MKRMIGLLVVVGLMVSVVGFVGCSGDKDSSTGPQGQTLEVYNGKDEWGDRIEYQFYWIHSEADGEEKTNHGFYKTYYESGKLMWDGNYLDGKKEGKWVRYYESGNVDEETNFVDGAWDGKHVLYDEEGNITREECYEMDEGVDCP